MSVTKTESAKMADQVHEGGTYIIKDGKPIKAIMPDQPRKPVKKDGDK